MESLIIDRDERQWTFTLNRPEKRNALSSTLVEALIGGVTEATTRHIPQLIFQGAGKNLSAGFDFTDYENQSEGDLALRFIRIEQLLQLIASAPALTIGLAHGRNFGAGVDLFAACRLRYCTPDATFLMPGLKFGLVLGTRRFRNIVGAANAADILSAVTIAISGLPPAQRECCQAVLLQDLSLLEASKAIGKPPKTIANRVSEGKATLRDRFRTYVDG